jgi:hypothetical protein
LVFRAITVVSNIIRVSYPLLSDSLQSNGGVFTRLPKTFARLMDPGIKKLQEIKLIPIKEIMDMQIIKIKLVMTFLRSSMTETFLSI